MERFLYLVDTHYGFERRNGHKVPLHDSKAIKIALDFAKDFKPDHIVLGGDILDCGCVSHHNHGKPGATEGMKLIEDAKGCSDMILKPLEALKAKTYTYIVANHEAWLADLEEKIPALEGMLSLEKVLDLDKRWKLIPQGEGHKLGKLLFLHGDQIKGGQYPAKWAVETYNKNVRFGHFHGYQAFSKTSPLDENTKTGILVPCLCKKNPLYGGGSPNKWSQGFLYGFLRDDGLYNDYVAIVTKGKAVIEGRLYEA